MNFHSVWICCCLAEHFVDILRCGKLCRSRRKEEEYAVSTNFRWLVRFPRKRLLANQSSRSSMGPETSACVITPAAKICFRKLLDNWISKHKVGVGFVFRSMSSERVSEWMLQKIPDAESGAQVVRARPSTPCSRLGYSDWRHRVVFSAMDFFMCSIVFRENVSCCELSGSVLLGKCFVVCAEKGKQFRLQRWCNRKARKYPSAVDLGEAFNIRCKALLYGAISSTTRLLSNDNGYDYDSRQHRSFDM